MLDIELPDMEEQSDISRGGVSPPELDVTVLERDREACGGRVKTGRRRTDPKSVMRNDKKRDNLQGSSPLPTQQPSPRLDLSSRPPD